MLFFRVLRPPGGETSFSFGSEENATPRKNKMASNIFAEPEDPHAHRRNNPPSNLHYFYNNKLASKLAFSFQILKSY